MKFPVTAAMLFLLFHLAGFAQQEAQFSHNMFNNMGINPGYAGLRSAICATGLARQQWVGLRDENDMRVSPETYTLNLDAPLPFLRGGAALGFIQDRLGYETNIGARISYSYHLRVPGGKLGLGAQLGFLDKRIDFSQFRPISGGDPVLGGGQETHMFTDFAIGGFFLSDKYWAGISATQLAEASGQLGNSMYSLRRHMYLAAGYNLPWSGNPSYVIRPSLLAKTDMASFQLDINTMVVYNNQFWGGVSFRPQDAVVFLFGLHWDQISVGYSYDFTTSPLGSNGRSNGSHEIMLQYCFKLDIDKIREIQRNIRFL